MPEDNIPCREGNESTHGLSKQGECESTNLYRPTYDCAGRLASFADQKTIRLKKKRTRDFSVCSVESKKKISTSSVQMAKKRVKKRTHVKKVDNPSDPKIPKSFVIRTGKTTADPTSSVLAQLVLDVRKILEPNTATRLRVCRTLLYLNVG